MYTKLGSDGIAVTVLTPVEAGALVARASEDVLARPSGPVEKEIASLATLIRRTAERGADESLTPQEYHISARTHRAFGLTADGRYVMVCPVMGDLVAISRIVRPAARPALALAGVR